MSASGRESELDVSALFYRHIARAQLPEECTLDITPLARLLCKAQGMDFERQNDSSEGLIWLLTALEKSANMTVSTGAHISSLWMTQTTRHVTGHPQPEAEKNTTIQFPLAQWNAPVTIGSLFDKYTTTEEAEPNYRCSDITCDYYGKTHFRHFSYQFSDVVVISLNRILGIPKQKINPPKTNDSKYDAMRRSDGQADSEKMQKEWVSESASPGDANRRTTALYRSHGNITRAEIELKTIDEGDRKRMNDVPSEEREKFRALKTSFSDSMAAVFPYVLDCIAHTVH